MGQEGLDFHPYCHAVYHWNLPSNPVDLEQREGRVHRYKGHAVRKNVARRWGLATLAERLEGTTIPGAAVRRCGGRPGCHRSNELVPYWIYPIEGGAVVERRVRCSRSAGSEGSWRGCSRELAVYRLVFGQPRQEDLLALLVEGSAGGGETVVENRISLEPPRDGRNISEDVHPEVRVHDPGPPD